MTGTANNTDQSMTMGRQSKGGTQTMMSGLGDMLKVPQGLTSNMGIGSQLNATKMSGRTNNASAMKK